MEPIYVHSSILNNLTMNEILQSSLSNVFYEKLRLTLNELYLGVYRTVLVNGVQVEIMIPASSRPGQSLCFLLDRAILVVILELFPHPFFSLDGSDVKLKLDISLWEAQNGFEYMVELLDGRTIQIKRDYLHDSSEKIVFLGYGFYNKSTHATGNLIVEFNVIIRPQTNIRLFEDIQPSSPLSFDDIFDDISRYPYPHPPPSLSPLPINDISIEQETVHINDITLSDSDGDNENRDSDETGSNTNRSVLLSPKFSSQYSTTTATTTTVADSDKTILINRLDVPNITVNGIELQSYHLTGDLSSDHSCSSGKLGYNFDWEDDTNIDGQNRSDFMINNVSPRNISAGNSPLRLVTSYTQTSPLLPRSPTHNWTYSPKQEPSFTQSAPFSLRLATSPILNIPPSPSPRLVTSPTGTSPLRLSQATLPTLDRASSSMSTTLTPASSPRLEPPLATATAAAAASSPKCRSTLENSNMEDDITVFHLAPSDEDGSKVEPAPRCAVM